MSVAIGTRIIVAEHTYEFSDYRTPRPCWSRAVAVDAEGRPTAWWPVDSFSACEMLNLLVERSVALRRANQLLYSVYCSTDHLNLAPGFPERVIADWKKIYQEYRSCPTTHPSTSALVSP